MKSTPSPRVRFLAVLALILLAGAGAYLLIHNSSKSTSASDTTGTQATSHTTTRTQTTAKRSSKSHERKRKTSVEGAAALDAALVAHPVVVVSVYARNVVTDYEAMKEAEAGAASVGAGFVAFDIYQEKLARQLATLLGDSSQTTNPEVLIFKRPRKLAFELQGFADSQVVAQAAHNVYPYEEPWVSEANRICAHYALLISKATSASNSINGQLGDTITSSSTPDQIVKLFNDEVQVLSAVRVTASKAASYQRFIADLRQAAALVSSYVKALNRGDRASAQAIGNQLESLAASINALIAELHLASCAA
jgi:hypothetical protein